MSRVVGVMLAITLAGAPAAAIARHRDARVDRPQLVEMASCRSEAPATTTTGTSDELLVTVAIPGVAIVHIDPAGRITAALTNTGCAPRQSDMVYVRNADGALTLSTTLRLERVRWTGDFTEIGVLQPQRTAAHSSD
jgi:hypothetical protein